jgi:GrpB-like predicted nucleotidyltransferase (UPF0157 family)
MKVYRFRKYEKEFPGLYSNEKKRISRIIPKNSLIEHVGSTAVPGLHGKGIIDIMISCPKKSINKVKGNLEKKGYRKGRSSDKDRIFLKRDAKIKGKARRFHMHIVPLNHSIHRNAIGFRNHLIKNPEVSKEYSELKKKAVIKCNNDGEIYRKLKNRFIRNCIKKAIKK